MGGGNVEGKMRLCAREGLSPRGRGKPEEDAHREAQGGSIPAWAGETPRIDQRRLIVAVYPRVGGGNWQLRGVV